MTSKKTAIIAVCGVAGTVAAIMTAVLYKNGNTQDIEPFDMEEDFFLMKKMSQNLIRMSRYMMYEPY